MANNDTRWERRDAKRRAQVRMGVDGRSVQLLYELGRKPFKKFRKPIVRTAGKGS